MLNEDYKDILQVFLAEGVEFLVVGAYALAAHGLPRATGDIDLWVRPEVGNAGKVLRALAAFGAPVKDLTPADFSVPDVIFQIGVVPRRVDIITSIDGVTFDEAFPARLDLDLEGIRIPVLSRAHLLQNKEATGRAKDRLDLEALLRKKR
ncbi:MAG: hypothetical protein GX442_18310 [Candidatus Riflebacteria bacterium]|nr:hypothetical protein [Candidatus Riflebacteria bacterium]